MKQIDKITKRKLLLINLANNNFKCNCTDIEFVRYIQQKILVHDLKKECASYTLLIVVASILVSAFLSILTGGIIYRYRWDLRYLYYSTKFRMKGYMPVDADQNRFRHDVFVSYNDQERHFVIVDLLHELEKSRSLKLCIHERDFFLGGMVTENIVYAINNSRKTDTSFNGAHGKPLVQIRVEHGQDEGNQDWNKCPVYRLDGRNHDNLPLEVIDAIRNHTYIQHPREREHMNMFWDRLHTATTE
ncbi:TLR4-like protein [Mya arenaria]|uniref:TLR4-like protein n=1 Tax=Mya arenaria TaxID=6604 RepID=A0ABY7E2H2_MYAAR|nr:TLR4-like protein [Mya arenaria]